MQAIDKSVKAVVIGAGTGSFTVITGLKQYLRNITTVVNMTDSGGSTGVLRDELGALPPGDARQHLVALANRSDLVRELFNYRFGGNTFKGHSFGNLFLAALEDMTGDFEQALSVAGEILDISGKVLPVTTTQTNLCLVREGQDVCGEDNILGTVIEQKKPEFYLEPTAKLNPRARQAILDADLLVFGPGGFYTSLMTILLTEGIVEAIAQSKAKRVFISNLMTQPNQSRDYNLDDFVDELERFTAGRIFDYIVYNNAQPANVLIDRYLAENERLIDVSPKIINRVKARGYKTYGDLLISHDIAETNQVDLMQRSLIRHDPDSLARAIMRCYFD
ncbi:uridine diphosphate-N-acetylglucosamine-binding protein YvcK [Candidatus Saccharibacteria bacterium]|nr:uridine diphosphate-N-acetylglucosamine-binding protein YvcK [Candidatus Saccharibacteria bacterium]